MTYLQNLTIIFFAHLVCDFALQNDFVAQWKARNNYILFVHCFTWATGVSLALQYLSIFSPWKLVMLFVGHILMDAWKCRGWYKKLKISDMNSLYIDQIFHFVQVALCII